MKTLKLIFERQLYHYLFLAALITAVYFLTKWPGVYDGSLWGLGIRFWFWLSVGIVILHQFNVWFFWRTELHLDLMTRKLGRFEFPIWSVLFMIIFACRGISVFVVGYANRGTWDINPVIGWIVTFVILIPAVYTLYSIIRYFGLKRALGIDHFDPAYRSIDLVKQGIYKYVPNAMYIFALTVLWIPAFIFSSRAALVLAFFNHSYIWVHYFTVEVPDMKRIYGSK